LAKLILARLEQETRTLGLRLMRLETGTLQPEALSLFAGMGFAPRGPFGDYPADDPYSVFMEKEL
jgi:putative acetyltransferase